MAMRFFAIGVNMLRGAVLKNAGRNYMKALLIVLVLASSTGSAAAAVHDDIGALRCLACHVRTPFPGKERLFRSTTAEVCAGCHAGHPAAAGTSHPVDVAPSMSIPPDMPLDEKGRMTCITCHGFHTEEMKERGRMLRRPRGKPLCSACHLRRGRNTALP